MESFLPLLNLIPHILILVAAIQLVSKFSQPESYLILIGSITGLLVSLYFSFFLRFFPYDSLTDQRGVIELAGGISTLGHLFFAIGLFLLVKKFIDGSEKK